MPSPESPEPHVSDELIEAKRQHELARLEADTERAKVEAARLRASRMEPPPIPRRQEAEIPVKLLESLAMTDFGGEFFSQLADYYDISGEGGWWGPAFMTAARRNGANWPFFRTEQELHFYRNASRWVVGRNPHASGLIGGVCSYVIGKGMAVKATPTDGTNDPADMHLCRLVQHELDYFAKRVNWPELQQQIFNETLTDGEYFLALFDQGDHLAIRGVLPELVKQPPGEPMDVWSFGIQTPVDDPWTVEAYHIAEYDGSRGHILNADEVIHFPLPTPGRWTRGIKRAMPLFAHGVKDAFDNAGKLLKNMGVGVAVRQKFAFFRQWDGISRESASDFTSAAADLQVQRTWGSGQSRNYQDSPPGMVVDAPAGMNFAALPSSPETSAAIEVVDALLRNAVAILNAPEWLASGNARNMGAYASSMVAESPFVKRCEQLQEFFSGRFLKVLERVVDIAVRAGRLPAEVLSRVKLSMEHPTLTARNKGEEASRDSTYVQMGVKSRQQVAQEQGLDYDKQFQENLDFQKKTLQAQIELAKLQQQLQQLQGGAGGGQPGMGGPPAGPGGGGGDDGSGGPGGMPAPSMPGMEQGGDDPGSDLSPFGDVAESVHVGPVWTVVALTESMHAALMESAKAGPVLLVESFDQLNHVQLMEKGFTGTIKDKIGRTYYYVDGRRISKAKATETGFAEKHQPKDASVARKALMAVMNREDVTDQHFADIAEHLPAMTVKDLRMFKASLLRGVPARDKEALIERVREGARKRAEQSRANEERFNAEQKRAAEAPETSGKAPEVAKGAPEVDPQHIADIERGRQADQKFRGEGRYEAEVWTKIRKKNPDTALPPLSKEAAEWVADEYDRDGKPVPAEVLAPHPELAKNYKNIEKPKGVKSEQSQEKKTKEPWESAAELAYSGDVSAAMKALSSLSLEELKKQAAKAGVSDYKANKSVLLQRFQQNLSSMTPEARDKGQKDQADRTNYLDARHLLQTIVDGQHSPFAEVKGKTNEEVRKGINEQDPEILAALRQSTADMLRNAAGKLDQSSPDHAALASKIDAALKPFAPPADSPGFTGTDSLGREWVDGKLVAKQDDAGQPAPQASEGAAGAEAPNIGGKKVRGRIEWDGTLVKDDAGNRELYQAEDGSLHRSENAYKTALRDKRKQQKEEETKQQNDELNQQQQDAQSADRESRVRQGVENMNAVVAHVMGEAKKALKDAGFGAEARRIKETGVGSINLPSDASEEAKKVLKAVVGKYAGKIDPARMSPEEVRSKLNEISSSNPATDQPATGSQEFDAAARQSDFGKIIQQIADQTMTGGYLGDNKVLISHAYEEAKKQFPGLTLDQFKQQLLRLNQERKITIGRADMGQLIDPKEIEASQIAHQNGTFHTILSNNPNRKLADEVGKGEQIAQSTDGMTERQKRIAENRANNHEYTLDEWRKYRGYDRAQPQEKAAIDAAHRKIVEDAAMAQLDVPPEVLADYPGISTDPVADIKAAYDNATDLSKSIDEVNATLSKLDQMGKAQLLQVADALDHRGMASKPAQRIRDELRQIVLDRRSAEQRARMIRGDEDEPVAENPSGATDQPGFTGTDSLGREWVNGELVKKQDDGAAGGEQASAETPTDAGKPPEEPPVTPPVASGGEEPKGETPETSRKESQSKDDEHKRLNRAPVGMHNLGKRGRLVISGATREIKDKLKARNWKYDPSTQTWSYDLVAPYADRIRNGGEDRIDFLKGLNAVTNGVKVALDGEPVMIGRKHPDAEKRLGNTPESDKTPESGKTRMRFASEKATAVAMTPAPGSFIRVPGSDGQWEEVVSAGKPQWHEDEMRWKVEYKTKPAKPSDAEGQELAYQVGQIKRKIKQIRAAMQDDDRYKGEDIPSLQKQASDMVSAAIEAGKSVPTEVLADYPDLAEKYGKKATASDQGFTGTDSQGREWVNGELVAKQDDGAATGGGQAASTPTTDAGKPPEEPPARGPEVASGGEDVPEWMQLAKQMLDAATESSDLIKSADEWSKLVMKMTQEQRRELATHLGVDPTNYRNRYGARLRPDDYWSALDAELEERRKPIRRRREMQSVVENPRKYGFSKRDVASTEGLTLHNQELYSRSGSAPTEVYKEGDVLTVDGQPHYVVKAAKPTFSAGYRDGREQVGPNKHRQNLLIRPATELEIMDKQIADLEREHGTYSRSSDMTIDNTSKIAELRKQRESLIRGNS